MQVERSTDFDKRNTYGIRMAHLLSDRIVEAKISGENFVVENLREQLEYQASVNRRGLTVIDGRRD